MNAREVVKRFSDTSLPQGNDLVVFDGYDTFEKQDAVAIFGGKDARLMLALLKQGALGNAFNALEELNVLEPPAIRYYLGPFLVHLIEIADHLVENDEYVANVLFRLLQLVRQHGPHLFTPEQREALLWITAYVGRCAKQKDELWPWRRDIIDYAEQCSAVLLKDECDGNQGKPPD